MKINKIIYVYNDGSISFGIRRKKEYTIEWTKETNRLCDIANQPEKKCNKIIFGYKDIYIFK
jgi:hypothetical protein